MNDGRSPRQATPPESDGAAFVAGKAGMAGQRLDFSLRLLLPHMGQRGRKRCIESGLVLVNGRPASAARRLRPDDIVSLAPEGVAARAQNGTVALARDSGDAAPQWGTACTPQTGRAATHGGEPAACCGDPARFLCAHGAYCFFYKPAGLHSVALAGGGGRSLESLLHVLLPDTAAAPGGAENSALTAVAAVAATEALAATGAPGPAASRPWPRLLQRLDCGTSGIVCAALDAEAVRNFRADEAAGRCEKRYVALLAGQLTTAVTVKNALRTDKRSKSLLLESGADKSRWTDFLPLGTVDAADIFSWLAALVAPTGVASAPIASPCAHPAARLSADPASGVCPGLPAEVPFAPPSKSLTDAGPDHLHAPCAAASGLPYAVDEATRCAQRLTLVGCRIRRGARHQIRAHAASLGHPLWGDALYGGQSGDVLPEGSPTQGVFYLHHGGLLLPAARCVVPPPWPFLATEALRRVMEWLNGGPALSATGGSLAQGKKVTI